MSFLDRFKRKASEEKTPDNAPEVKSEPTQDAKSDSAAGAPARKVDPAIQIAAAAVAAGYNPDFKLPSRKEKEPGTPAPAADSGPQHEVILELGDFLPRLPAQALKEGSHDPKTPLTFDIAELADRISRGQTTISLAEVYRRVPSIFRSEVLTSDGTEVRFPWQKVMKMLTAYKSATGGPAPAGLSSAAAETLAEKLRSRRGVRNIIPGGPASEATAPAPASAVPPPIAPLPKAPELVLPASNPDEDEKMSKEDALKARDQLRNMLARIKGEFERHMAAGDQQRKALAEEREKMVVDLVRTRKEIDDKTEQVEFEKSVAAKSTDNLTKTQQERDSFKIELSNLKVEVSKLSQQNDQRIKDLITERDALAQQQANLSKQITEFQKRGKIGTMLAAETAPGAAAAGTAAAERSQKENQRQVEELQRRIGILETGQREAAQELGREREAKIKIERQLAAADRLQEESAAKVQEVQNMLQREHEAATRKREAESARALKDLQEQFTVLQSSHQKLQADADETRKQLQTAHEAAAVAAASAAAAAAAPGDWEARATAQFEADIESYRSRIKGLLQERSTLGNEKQKLAAELAARTQELTREAEEKAVLAKAHAEATPKGDADQLVAENSTLQTRLKALEAERDALAAHTKAQDEKIAGATSTVTATAADLQKVASEKEQTAAELARIKAELNAELDKIKAELTAATAKHQETVQELHDRHTAELTAKESALQTLQATPTADPAELAQLRAELDGLRSGSSATIETLQGEARKAAAERDALSAELNRLKEAQQASKERLESELTAALKARESESKTLGELRTATEKFFAEKKALTDEVASLRSTHEATLSASAAATEKTLAELNARLETLSTEKNSLTEELTTLRTSTAAAAATAQAASAKALAEGRASQEKLAAEKSALTNELAALRATHETTFSTTKEAHEKAVNALVADRDDLRGKVTVHARELEALRKQREELISGRETLTAENFAARSSLEKSLTEVTRHRDDLVNKIEIMASELAGAKQEHGLAFAALDRDRDSLRAAKDAIAAEFASTRASLEKTIADLHNSHDTLAANKGEVDQQLANAMRRGDDLQSRLEKTEAALSETQAALKKREEAAVRQTRDHTDAVARLTTKHEDVLAALAAEKDAAIARLTSEKSTLLAEVDDKIATLKAGHEKAVHSLRDEKSEAVIRLTEEMNATVAALSMDRDKVRDALAEAERKYLAEIAGLLEARDSAQNDSAAVAERLAAVSVEAEQKHSHLTVERDTILADKLKLIAELDQARETHKAQAGVFASEFKAVVKQRDDFIAQLEAERKNLAQRSAAFEHDRAAMTANENELKARTEREIARIRRERDSIAQQRDALRGRIGKLMDDQRQMLDDVASQAAFTSMKHNEPAATPTEKEPEPPIEAEPAAASKPRDTRPREPRKETNVIDITEAEIVAPLHGEEGRLKMPRVRPVIIPPPQVRSL